MEGATRGRVHVISRRMVRPSTPPPAAKGDEVEVINLTPLDLRLIRTDYLQKGILLPNPPVIAGGATALVDAMEASFARALARFYPFAGRLAADERGDGTVTVSLRCTGEGAEFVHAVAPGIAAGDIVSSIYTPAFVRYELHSFDPAHGGEVAADEGLPLVSVQVTELADGVFVGITLNHSVGDGTALWHFLNTWSKIHRLGVGDDDDGDLSTPPPVLRRWFEATWPVPIPLPFAKLEDIARQVEQTVVKECFLTFSGESVMNLTSRANNEITGMATATITSLQATMAHLWRAVCRARRLPRQQVTSYTVVIDCRGHVEGMPRGYVGNAEAFGKAEATAGEVEEKGLGWTAWQLSRAMASFDEASFREEVDTWVRRPEFLFITSLTFAGTAVATGSSSWREVFGNNDFGWGMAVAVRSGAGNKTDGKAAVFEEPPELGGGMAVELCLATGVLERLVADEEFMDAVSLPPGGLRG
ncbi:hypothetical protein HU200_052265 [Digitaria exilis]|uniref:Acetyltransferase n=1 Tax=Digitaria exilis TaxID=1010633 RepID=A0A835AP47_9POAL|nr:hypothetical protein HU200_052265 [Digitaria exilis]CAB3479718.1 unnamed protein product [Digitaria exilis]